MHWGVTNSISDINMNIREGLKKQNGNFSWHVPLSVGPPLPPPLNGTHFHPFLPHFLTFTIESYLGLSPIWEGGGSGSHNLLCFLVTIFFVLKHPEMQWNIWYSYLKWREMLCLTISWCYDSKIRSVLGLAGGEGGSRLLNQKLTFGVLNVLCLWGRGH